MQNQVFVDASAWIGQLSADDEYHEQFNSLFFQLRHEKRPLVTTDWILAETGNGLARVRARLRFPQIVRMFLQSSNCKLVRVNAELFRRTLELYELVSDKTWGMVDCASFTVMRYAGITDAATSDAHFEQAGFRRLGTKS
jgi:predicted nucleic acid-binding protein